MKKLLLEMETLEVESFPTLAPPVEPAGTVHANMRTKAVDSCFTSCRADLRDACTCPV